jgi:hypothetical protein
MDILEQRLGKADLEEALTSPLPSKNNSPKPMLEGKQLTAI